MNPRNLFGMDCSIVCSTSCPGQSLFTSVVQTVLAEVLMLPPDPFFLCNSSLVGNLHVAASELERDDPLDLGEVIMSWCILRPNHLTTIYQNIWLLLELNYYYTCYSIIIPFCTNYFKCKYKKLLNIVGRCT